MKRFILLSLAIVAVILFVRWSFYTVDAAEYAYVTVLGQHVATYDGADAKNGAGLKFGWPWPIQQVQRLDRRLQQFDLSEFEQLTHEGQTVDKILVIQAYVCWKIENEQAVDKFVKQMGSPEKAKEILSRSINSRLGGLIGQKKMDDLVNTAVDPKTGEKLVDATSRELHKKLRDDVKAEAKDYGIELVDIRMRRFNHPGNVRDSIYQRISTERRKEAARYESDGKRQASDILAKADAEVRETLAAARADEVRIMSEADRTALQIRNDAYRLDPEFYKFLKDLEELQNIVGGKNTMLLLSTHRPLFESLFTPPRPKAEAPKDKQK
jgi:modulator of FtsH protease HflC